MRKKLLIFCVITAVLSAISFIGGILVIAAFFAVIPAIVLGFAPDALMVGMTWLLVDIFLPRRPSLHKGAIALTTAGLLLTLALVAAWFNRPLEQDVKALTRDDHDLSASLTGTRNIAVQFITNERARSEGERERAAQSQQDDETTPGALPPPVRKQFCERLCLHLLFNGLADSVIVSSVPAAEGVLTPDPGEVGVRFHLQRAACRKPDIDTDDVFGPPFRLFERGTEKEFESEISDRMIRGQCVIGEPARLSEAQIILQENPNALPESDRPSRPVAGTIVHLIWAPQSAARFSIYRVQDGSIDEVFRQTQVQAYSLLPVLLLGPVITGEGGIGISEGFLRRHRVYSEFKLRDLLESKLGLNVVPISR